uniref:Peptidase C1A papain C-terminal domain-containing protein n=1 Tax=Athene cunicularia TaxID=194338 RepID=A0A663LM10_ATHCN
METPNGFGGDHAVHPSWGVRRARYHSGSSATVHTSWQGYSASSGPRPAPSTASWPTPCRSLWGRRRRQTTSTTASSTATRSSSGRVTAARRSTSTASTPSSITCGMGMGWGGVRDGVPCSPLAASLLCCRFVHSRNRAALSYTLALNHLADRTPQELADRTPQELAALRGRRWSGAPHNGQPFPTELYAGLILPESLDWRLYGAVTPVKDQAICGSCWSFATTGAMEGALFLKTGVLTPLSQQVLIDCSWGFGNRACDGGEEWRAYEWIKKHGGIASTESYGPYLGQNGYCHCNQSELVAQLAGYATVDPGSAMALKAALVKHGPVAVNIDASHKSFAFYANGVYEEPHCGESTQEAPSLDHAVLAVGYGVLHGKSYWLIKNSWSTYWGNDGYILMAMKDNNCGVATAASFPILA